MSANKNDNQNLVTLFYNEFSSPSRKVLMALYEKKVEFIPRSIDLSNFEQHERWFLDLNPRGEVPILMHGDQVIVDSNVILEYIDKNFGRPNQLFPADLNALDRMRHFIVKIDSIVMFVLTFGAAIFHTEHVTDCLRYPFCDELRRAKYRHMITSQPEKLRQKSEEFADHPAGRVLGEKAFRIAEFSMVFTDLSKYQKILHQVESILDEVESELGSDNHSGPWLCGPTFSAADLCMVALLLRLHQVGLDEKFWKHGRRPSIAVYQEMAFKRDSFEKATKWSEHKDDILIVNASQGPSIDSATIGLGVVLALGAAYIYKKFKN